MSDNLQKVIDDTIVLYNGVYTKTYKSIVRSHDYKNYLSNLSDVEAVVSQTILQKIAYKAKKNSKRETFVRSIKISRVPDSDEIALMKETL